MMDLERLRQTANRLAEIAGSVASEASGLTSTLRAVGDHAQDIAALAAELDDATREIETNMAAQLELLVAAQRHVAENEPVMGALADSVEVIAAMSAQIREIAGRSRLLSLNARIEAARSDAGGGFAAVAAAMTELAANTRTATQDIDERAAMIGGNVQSARTVIAGGVALVDREQMMIKRISERTASQRLLAGRVRELTLETVERIDDAAVGVGRVASTAVVLGVLARQIVPVAV